MLPLYKETNFEGVKKFYLLMGSACNMQCRHCIQTPIKFSESKYDLTCSSIDERVISLMENYVRYCVETPLSSKKKPYFMYFWGGEPLLYWDFIKKTVKDFTERFDILKNRNFRFRMTSNGTLLTNEMIDFINKYQIKFHFSYDAPYPFAVRDYVSDDVCEMVKKIKGHEIQCNYSAYNCDQLLAYRCSKAKFPEAHVQTNLKLIRTFAEIPKDAITYDMNKVRNSIRKIRIAFQMGDPYIDRWLWNRYLLPGAISRGYFTPDVGNENMLCVTTHGNVEIGFNFSLFISTIEESMNEIFQKIFEAKKSLLSSACSFCKNKDICKAPLFDIKNDAGNYVSCLEFYVKYYDIVREEMSKLASVLSDEDIKWYREQELIMEDQIKMYLNEGKRYEIEKTRLPKDMMYRIRG